MKKKLLYILTDIATNGGVDRIVFDKINALIDSYNTSILYLGNRNTPFYGLDSKVKTYNLPLRGKGILKYIHLINDYKKLLNEIKPNLIINANSILLTWIIPFIGKQKNVLELHQSYEGVKIFNDTNYGVGTLKNKFHFWLRDIVYPHYDKVVVLTNDDKNKWGYNNMIVIPNFTNLYSSTPYTPDVKNIIWVGRLTYQKGADLLSEIWGEFRKRNHDWKLLIIGDEPGSDIKENLLASLHDDLNVGRVKYVNSTSEIEMYYSQSSIYISSSRYEGLPLAMIEAITFGLPCVGFSITGNTDIIKNAENGYLIPKDDIGSFVDKLSDLCTDKEKRISFSKISIKRASMYSKPFVLDRWKTLINSLCV